MGGKTAIAAGLAMGLVVGAIAFGAVVLTPGLVVPASPAVAEPSASPAPPSASASPSGSPAPSASGAPSGSPGASAPASVDPGEAFGIGKVAPPLAVARLGGGDMTLTALKGSPVWVNFMATWCPPCRDEIPRMNAFAARYAETGLTVIAIDVREGQAQVDAFAKELGITFPVGLDADGTAQSDWGAYALPVHFWIDADGVVRDGALGGIGPDIMARGLQAILPGVTVSP